MTMTLIENFFPLALALVLAFLVPAGMILTAQILAPHRSNEKKLSSYECGIQPQGQVGDARIHVNVKFYLVAMCFLVFDVEVVFLLPWAVVFQKMAWGGLEALVGFLGVLAIGWFYLLKRGALDWE
jgi:NADH-quinone oxidoreductase subunit A